MSKELMIERIEKAQKEIEAKRETVQQGKFRQDYHFMTKSRISVTEIFEDTYRQRILCQLRMEDWRHLLIISHD